MLLINCNTICTSGEGTLKSNFFLKSKLVTVIPTTAHHLAEYTDWHKWEGDLTILEEEEAFANQKDRARRMHLLQHDTSDASFFLSILSAEDEELISLLELYIVDSELYCPYWIIKKVKNGSQLALETGRLLINYFFSYYPNLNSIMFDLPNYRTESIKLLEKFGFEQITHYYRLDSKNNWEKTIILRLRKH